MLICKDQKRFAYQCLDNVETYKYAKFDQIYRVIQKLYAFSLKYLNQP